MSVPSTLPVSNRTAITTDEQITFVNSPVHVRLQNTSTDNTIKSAYVYLWIWNGNQNTSLGKPNHTLFKEKVSASDTYINFQIDSYIKSYLENPPNAPNTNQPSFAYNEITLPAVTGQGVFWQIVTDITSTGGTVRNNYNTGFATLGYRWNYEQNAIGNNGIVNGGSTGYLRTVNDWKNPQIPNYFTQSFNLGRSVATATTANMITMSSVSPVSPWARCSKDTTLVAFINKIGLWQLFTMHGKFTPSSEIDFETTNKAFRDPSQIDNTYVHSKSKNNLDVLQSYVINTGALDETMIDNVEELIYSPKVYIIKFKGDVQETTTIGITIDNTYVTVDDTNITIDSQSTGVEFLGLFKTFQQIPVIVTDTDFQRLTRVNDKSEISYNIKFEETNNKINDIR